MADEPGETQQAYRIGPLDAAVVRWRRMLSGLIARFGAVIPIAVAMCVMTGIAILLYSSGLSLFVLLYCAFYLGLAQVALMARTRTLSFKALRGLAAVSVIVCPLLTLALMGLLRAIFDLTPIHPFAMTIFTPLVEETVKLLPVVAILLYSSRARSLSLIDIVLVGYLAGLGFDFVEELSRPENTWHKLRWHLLAEVPTDPGNLTSHFYTHALATAVVVTPVAFWWRARRLDRPTLPWAIVFSVVFAFVTITHAEINMALPRGPTRSLITFIGEPQFLPALAAAAAVCALLTDMWDTRRHRKLYRWLLPRLDFSSGRRLHDSLELNRLERAEAVAAVYGAPPLAPDFWTYSAASRLRNPGLHMLAIGIALSLAPFDSSNEAACLDCLANYLVAIAIAILMIGEIYLEFTVFGDARAIIEAYTGRDVFDGHELSWRLRLLAALSVVPLLGVLVDLSRALARARRLASGLDAAAHAARTSGNTTTVYRVQGGTPPRASRHIISIDANKNPVIQDTTLNVSIGDSSHAAHFQTQRPGSTVTSFEIPTWLDEFIQKNAIPQYGYRSNPLNQGGLAPKIVDPTTPGRSYELPSPWGKWLQEHAIPGSGKVE